MTDSIVFLDLPLIPATKVVEEILAADCRPQSGTLYFLRVREGRLVAHIRMFSEKFPSPGARKSPRPVELPERAGN